MADIKDKGGGYACVGRSWNLSCIEIVTNSKRRNTDDMETQAKKLDDTLASLKPEPAV